MRFWKLEAPFAMPSLIFAAAPLAAAWRSTYRLSSKEHDSVDVRRLVLRCRIGSDHRRRYCRDAARYSATNRERRSVISTQEPGGVASASCSS
jgi:hypothetical protein